MMRRLLSPLTTGLMVVAGLSIWTLQSVSQAENRSEDPSEVGGVQLVGRVLTQTKFLEMPGVAEYHLRWGSWNL